VFVHVCTCVCACVIKDYGVDRQSDDAPESDANELAKDAGSSRRISGVLLLRAKSTRTIGSRNMAP
jgi:hypothetical protein